MDTVKDRDIISIPSTAYDLEAATIAKNRKIALGVINLVAVKGYRVGHEFKINLIIDPNALALKPKVFRDIKRLYGARKVQDRLAAYSKNRGNTALSTMTFATFEVEVLDSHRFHGCWATV